MCEAKVCSSGQHCILVRYIRCCLGWAFAKGRGVLHASSYSTRIKRIRRDFTLVCPRLAVFFQTAGSPHTLRFLRSSSRQLGTRRLTWSGFTPSPPPPSPSPFGPAWWGGSAPIVRRGSRCRTFGMLPSESETQARAWFNAKRTCYGRSEARILVCIVNVTSHFLKGYQSNSVVHVMERRLEPLEPRG